MISTIAIVWVGVGLAGGLAFSREAYTWQGVLGMTLTGIVMGPFSVMLSFGRK